MRLFHDSRPIYRTRLETLITAATVLFVPVIAGCEWGGARYPTEPATQQLVVHGMLNAEAQEHEIVVEYTRAIGDGYFRGLTPAAGAEVLVSGQETHQFREDPARPGVYHASFSPRPGSRYLLQVRGPAGEVVTGETVVPGAPQFLAPVADTTISQGNYVTFRWTSAPGAAGYVVLDRPPGTPTPALLVLHPTIQADTSGTWPPGLFVGKLFDYRIAAVDSNYVRFIQGGSDPSRPERFRSTLSGGFGVFGSYAVSEPRTVTLR